MSKPYHLQADAQPTDIRLTDSHAGVLKLEAADGDGSSLKKFKITAYTGGKLDVGFGIPVVVDLSGIKVSAKSRPVLKDHNPATIVGHTNDIKISDGSITASGVVSATGEAAKEVTESSANGFPWQASIGASISRMVEVDRGESVQVNGRTFKGPLLVARQSQLKEISFVALGADDNTHARVAAQNGGATTETIAMNFEQWLEARGLKLADLTEDQVTKLKAHYEEYAELKAKSDTDESGDATPSGDDDGKGVTINADDEIAKIRAEAKRLTDLKAACGDHADIYAKAIDEDWDTDRTKLEVERAELHAKLAGVPHVGSTGRAKDQPQEGQVLEASLCLSAGMSEKFVGEQLPEKDRERVMNAAVQGGANGYRGAGIHTLMDAVIRAAGGFYGGSRRDNDYIRAALNAERQLQASTGFSTVSLSGILGNTANKQLLASFSAVDTVWNQIAAVRSLGDFKVHTRYRLDADGGYKKVGAGGELKHTSLQETSFTLQLETHGAIIALTRQQMINDDLGAFLQIPTMHGRMAAIKIEQEVFVLILGNSGSFFASANNNYFEGAATALSIDSLTTAKQKFRDMIDPNDKPVLVTPEILLVPSTLEQTADNLITESTIIDGTSTAKQPRRNPHAGTVRKAVSTYLNNTNIKDEDGDALTGQSDVGWYLFADPANRAAVNAGFLNGRVVPTIESADSDFTTLGMQWRSYHDFGVGFEEPQAGVKSKGEA